MSKGYSGIGKSSNGIPPSNVEGWRGTKGKDPFFGEVAKTSNKYMMVDQVTDADSAIIMTNNVQVVKGNMVMVTGRNTAVYLKNGQYRRMVSEDGAEAFAVKINRNYFKEYTFKSDFDFGGKKDTFDSLHQTAAQQQRQKTKWKSGGRIVISSNGWRLYN